MIRPYRTITHFDGGLDLNYDDVLLNILNYGHITRPVTPSVEPVIPYGEKQIFYPSSENLFLAPPATPQYVRNEPEIPTNMEEPAFRKLTPEQVISKPTHKRVTTAAQDRQAAHRTYVRELKAANAKARREVAKARNDVKKANTVLNSNGQPQYVVQKPKLTKETGKYGDVYSEYANMGPAIVGKRLAKKTMRSTTSRPKVLPKSQTPSKSKTTSTQTFSRPNHNIPGQSSNSNASEYWRKKKAAIDAAKKKRGEDTRGIIDRMSDWMTRNGIGRRVQGRPVVTTRGVGSYR